MESQDQAGLAGTTCQPWGARARLPLAALLACGLACCLWAAGSYSRERRGVEPPAPGSQISPAEAERLFRAMAFGNGYKKRAQAAKVLAQAKGGEAWVVVLLLDDTSRMWWETDEEVIEGLRAFDRASIAALLENIPTDADRAVLWAVAEHLSDANRGRYSRVVREWFTITRASCSTAPIREIARETLERCLGVDHGYDKTAWRAAIMGDAGPARRRAEDVR